MSNKPKIYANCKAGCLWETVHKDDFQRSAGFIRQNVTDNGSFKEFNLEAGQTCILKGDIVDENYFWKVVFEIRDEFNNIYQNATAILRDGWDTYIRVKHCGVFEQADGTYKIFYETNGTNGGQLSCANCNSPNLVIRLMYVDEVYLVNDAMDAILNAEEESV